MYYIIFYSHFNNLKNTKKGVLLTKTKKNDKKCL